MKINLFARAQVYLLEQNINYFSIFDFEIYF